MILCLAKTGGPLSVQLTSQGVENRPQVKSPGLSGPADITTSAREEELSENDSGRWPLEMGSSVSMNRSLQPHEIGAVSQTSSEPDKDQEIPFLEPSFPNGLIQSKRDGSRGVVSIFFNGNDHFFLDCPFG